MRPIIEAVDITFDFRSDTPVGKDPDLYSPTLRNYHRQLWSKTLPGGAFFDLTDATPGIYLHHRSSLGEFYLSSDAVIPSFRKERRLAAVIAQISGPEQGEFLRLGYTIGGMMLFPGNRIAGKMTINGARGFHPLIKDRFDLTVECIRRHYRGKDNPLRGVLDRYADFFALFAGFDGYVEHFLLQDLVSNDGASVRFFAPFDDFRSSPIPSNLDAYLSYRALASDFIAARNRRILNYCTP